MTELDTQFTGKYENSGRVATWLIDRFYCAVEQMLAADSAGSNILEIGCGAGYSTQRIKASLRAGQTLQATDIGSTLLSAAKARNPDVEFFQSSAYEIPAVSKSVDTIVMLEVLEHLEHPEAALAELARVARKRVVISTPREPLWCILNISRGKYLRHLGNTPGHLQHWSSAGLKRQVQENFAVAEMRTPIPWTVLRLTPH